MMDAEAAVATIMTTMDAEAAVARMRMAMATTTDSEKVVMMTMEAVVSGGCMLCVQGGGWARGRVDGSPPYSLFDSLLLRRSCRFYICVL
jgi:hypothetical protein